MVRAAQREWQLTQEPQPRYRAESATQAGHARRSGVGGSHARQPGVILGWMVRGVRRIECWWT